MATFGAAIIVLWIMKGLIKVAGWLLHVLIGFSVGLWKKI